MINVVIHAAPSPSSTSGTGVTVDAHGDKTFILVNSQQFKLLKKMQAIQREGTVTENQKEGKGKGKEKEASPKVTGVELHDDKNP